MAKLRHLLSPGEDGYRTPTIEDAEQRVHRRHFPLHLHPTGSLLQSLSHGHLHSPTASRADPEKIHSDTGSEDIRGCCKLPKGWPENLNWKQRIRHFTWAYFTLTMATGGIANVLHAGSSTPKHSVEKIVEVQFLVPFRFHGLETIGVIFFLANIVFYIIIWTLIILRFYFFPYTLKASLFHPTESLFIPASVVSFGTILINISQYGLGHTGPWLSDAVCVMFWIDVALAMIFSAGIYLMLYVI